MNNDWAKKWIGNLGTGKLLAMYADDVEFEDVVADHKASGKDELIAFFMSQGGPDAGEHTFTFERYSGDASGGAIEWTWHLKHGRDFLGIPAAGKETTVKGVAILTFRDGLITSHRDYWDAVSAVKQLGALE